jgi:molybdopterin adenylyltransferase
VYTAAVLTISDSSFHGTRVDLSGPKVVNRLEIAGFSVVLTAILPDEQDQIRSRLLDSCRQAQLVITVGGTGLAARDVTPEATLSVAERLVPGIPEKMRAAGMSTAPMAALSRAVCAIRGQSLILNLPGSPKAASESLQAVLELLPHALDLLGGKTEHRNA